MDKKRKIIAIVVPIVIILIALIIILCLLLPKKNNDKCAAGHDYKYTELNEENHKKSCKNCDKVDETEAHEYDNDTDTECNDCGYTRTVHTAHSYVYTKVDDTNHTKTCSGCDDTKTERHTLKYAKVDDNSHKITCSLCDYVKNEDHKYDNDEDATCNLCEYERHIHTLVYTEIDKVNHKVNCSGCEEIDKTEAHTQGQECEKCGYFDFVPSEVKFTASKTELVAGDTFEINLVISSKMPKNYVWHSLSLVLTALDSNNKVNMDIAKYFEKVSCTSSVDIDYYNDTSADRFSDKDPLYCGMLLSLSNTFSDTSKTPASQDIEFKIVLKVKEDAPDIASFAFGVAPTRANFLRYKDLETGKIINRQADNKTLVDYVEDPDAGDCLTIDKVSLSIAAKSN